MKCLPLIVGKNTHYYSLFNKDLNILHATLFLVLGLCCGTCLFFVQANDYQYISIEIFNDLKDTFFFDLLVLVFYVSHYIGIMGIMDRTEFYNINQLLSNLAISALLSYLIFSLLYLCICLNKVDILLF